MPLAMLSDFRLGWIVGIMDGEGWIGVRRGRPVAQLAMTDEDTVRRMAEWTGVGHVVGPVIAKDDIRKPHWRWTVTARDDAAEFIRALHPHLSGRRQTRADEILAAFVAAGPTKGTAPTCGYGHDITLESGNLRLIVDKHGYERRRCLACAARRGRQYNAARRLAREIKAGE